MNKEIRCENYPFCLVLLSNLLAFSIYGLGIYILSGFGIILPIIYLLFIFWIEFRLINKSCVDCYYYGKLCFSGRGLLCSLVLRKGNPERFLTKKISFKDLIPDFLVALGPFFAGIILLFFKFSIPLLIAVISIFIVGFFGNAILRGNFACKFCKQKGLGCPAEQFFNKNNT